MAESLSYQSIRTANVAREADEQRTEARKKNLLILVLQYLTEEGYVESAQSLAKETNLDLNRFEVCDNVDLATVLMEYESYYYIKFARYPKITKKLTQSAADDRSTKFSKLRRSHTMPPLEDTPRGKVPGRNALPRLKEAGRNHTTSTPSLPRLPAQQKPPTPPSGATRPRSGVKRSTSQKDPKNIKQNGVYNGTLSQSNSSDAVDALALQGIVVHSSNSGTDVAATQQSSRQPKGRKGGQIIDIRSMINDATRLNVEEGTSLDSSANRILKPLGGYQGYSSEWRELAQTISRDIYSENPNVRWDDIIGLDTAKQLVKEAVVYPIKYPQLFTGILSPWKGLLLFGPSGTGKTLLAKAVATECNTTFFNISASSIVSKWRGDSEKLVRVLFEMARYHAPSTIFLDELESLMSQRGGGGPGGEHEGSKRMKTELLVQMDGLSKTDDLVFLLAASNLPWELDHAMLRRLEKRIIVDLPTQDARKAMFMHHLPPVVCTARQNGLELMSELDYETSAMRTEGYSGADIRLVCKEAAMRPVRKIFDALENSSEVEELHIKLNPVTTDDILSALQHSKPSTRLLQEKYESWQREYESV